jgi:hypothetical protein
VAARTLEVIGPMPGIVFRRRATVSVSEVRLISAVTSSILTLVSRNCQVVLLCLEIAQVAYTMPTQTAVQTRA